MTVATHRFAQRMSAFQGSVVREILKVASQPDILSFAGGLPAPELFPVEELKEAFDAVLTHDGPAALQYSTTEGYQSLREWIANRLASRGCRVGPEHILITTGSQQGIDLVARVLLDPGDAVVLESPSYLAAIQVFRAYQARLCPVPADEHGMCVDHLEETIRQHRPRLIYLVPNFQNPSGATLSLERRKRLVDIASRHQIPILEDDPYGELRYHGASIPPMKALDESGLVINLGTFSKVLAPGLRVAWAASPDWIHSKLVVAKQASDLHTGTTDQRAVAYYLHHHDLDDRLVKLCAHYGQRCEVMGSALREQFPACAHWTAPDGGMFYWLRLPRGMNAAALFKTAIEQKVAFVPGWPFFAEGGGDEYMRLNFSNQPPDGIREGVRRLAAAMTGL